MYKFHLQNEWLWLLPEKAIYWPQQATLFIADTHFGKITHFRKAGLGVPDGAAHSNLLRFEELLKALQPKRVLFLGDLFHSDLNTEWLYFKESIRKFPQISFELVAGNHDILHHLSYQNLNFTLYEQPIEFGPFTLSHEPLEEAKGYNLCGHLHPGLRLLGGAKQSLRLPCFYFGATQGILPAFGEFTGLHILKPKKTDQLFVVSGKEVVQVN